MFTQTEQTNSFTQTEQSNSSYGDQRQVIINCETINRDKLLYIIKKEMIELYI